MKKVPRILGLIIVSFVAAIYLFIIIAGLFDPEPFSLSIESWGIVTLTLLTTASVVIGWIKPRLGVWLVLAVGVVFTIFGLVTAERNRWMAVVAAGGPLILGGILMLWGLWLERED
jgi:hypothetical protein